MSTGRNRDYRKLYRANISRNAWQPYPSNRPQFSLQKSKRNEEEEDLFPETRLIDSSVKICNSRVEFELAHYPQVNHKSHEGRAKVIVLNAVEVEELPQAVRTPSRISGGLPLKLSSPVLNVKVNGVSKPDQPKQTTKDDDPDGPPTPKVSLFSENKIVLGWKKVFPVGAGMYNLGNTCYLNSTLQALFYIPSFCNWLLSESELNENNGCEELDDNGEKCIICAMSATLKITRSKAGNVIKPYLIYSRLKSICKHMSHGRQEDAHEFLRYLLEKMEQSYLDRLKGKQLDSASKETTPLHRIFGGYMRTEICCLMCKGTSTTFQHFQDLLLDIRRSSSLEDALRVFFSRESLEGDDGGGGDGGGDAYKCGKCQRKGYCIKRNFVQTPPKVLCIQLKRFTAMGGKLVKHVSYPEKLDMAQYIYRKNPGPVNSSPCNQRRPPLMYHLTSVVSHFGASMNSGHYTAYAKSPEGSFYEFDDSVVHQVSLHSALGVSAYILMYEMVPSREEGAQSYTPAKSTSSIFPSLLESSVDKLRTFAMPSNRPKLTFGSSPRPVNGVAIPVASNSPTTTSKALSNCTELPPAKERDKVFFGIKSPSQTTSNGFSSTSQPSRLNGTSISRGLSEHNGVSVKKSSPEPKFQHSVPRTIPKVNSVNGNLSKSSRNTLHSNNSSLDSNSTKPPSPAVFPFSLIECNRILKSGVSPVKRSLVSHNGTAMQDGNSKEVAVKSLNRLSKLGVLVGVSGKGRDVEGNNGKMDHLVPYPVLSGESSDEEDERRGKRCRKSSESGMSKPVTPASEMTISGNLTPDATAIAAMRGWKVTGSNVSIHSVDPHSSMDSRETVVIHIRKDMSKDKVEMSVSNGRTGEGNSGSSCNGESKKLRTSEEGGERRESVEVGLHTVNSDQVEERQSGSSRPSSPCSSTSSHSSDSCSRVVVGTTSIKSFLKILERSSCNLMEEAERKNSAESPSKCKSLANGTGSVVAGEGDIVPEGSGVVSNAWKRNQIIRKNICKDNDRNSTSCSSTPLSIDERLSTYNVEKKLSLMQRVEEWLNKNDLDEKFVSKLDKHRILGSPQLNHRTNFSNNNKKSTRRRKKLCNDADLEYSMSKYCKNCKYTSRRSNFQQKSLHNKLVTESNCNSVIKCFHPQLEIKDNISCKISLWKRVNNIVKLLDQECDSDSEISSPGEVTHCSYRSSDSSGFISKDCLHGSIEIGDKQLSGDCMTGFNKINSMEVSKDSVLGSKEFISEPVSQENRGCSTLSSSSLSEKYGKVPQSSGASSVAALGRSDSRSLISNPS